MSAWQLRRWFKESGGRSKACVTRPVLTEQKKAARVSWATQRLHELDIHYNKAPIPTVDEQDNGGEEIDIRREPHSSKGPYYTFLDEKWFYCVSRRRRVKYLPKQSYEDPGVDDYPPERVASRRFTTKVMFMGVIACPHPDRDFDGKILMKRVSELKTAQRTTHYKNIVDNFEVNRSIHAGWRSLCRGDESLDAGEALDKIQMTPAWEIDEQTREHLVLRYCAYTASGKRKWVTLKEADYLHNR